MSQYTASYAVRYQTPSLQQQIEVAGVHAATDIQNEDAGAPNHADRLRWANWYAKNSSVGFVAFSWPVAMNPTIAASIESNPSGEGVSDSDVQFVVNGNVDKVIADFIANPPPGG